MLYYNKIDVWEGINIHKSNKSKESMICHCWYFLDDNYKYEPDVCNGCHDTSMMAYELKKYCNNECKRCWLYMCYIEYD